LNDRNRTSKEAFRGIRSVSENQAMYTVKTAAHRLSVCPSVVYDLVASGAIPHYRFGKNGCRGAIRIDEADLDAFLAAQKRKKGPEAMPPAPRKPRVILKHLRLRSC
jgi:excisionase family DNA binding protein